MSVNYGETDWKSDSIGNKREHPGDDFDGTKKARTDDNASKVVHIRGLPAVVSDSEVQEFGRPFGSVVKHLMMFSKGQAFLEFENVEQAQAMINCYAYNKAMIQNQEVKVQFSSHQELKLKDRQENQPSSSMKSNEPSKVIHIRQLPQVYTDDEIRELGLPFGRMTNHLIMRSRGQAFIEFESLENAKTMINYFAYASPTIRNQTVFIQYSSHQELKTRDLPPINQDNYPQQQQPKQEATSYSEEAAPMPMGPPRIVKVIVTNIKYPVSIEVLEKVFQRCGKIQKIVTFIQNDQFHALIQYGTPEEAVTAKSLLDWQNIYTGCNTLNVTFSKLEQLHVKFNNDKMRDFTNPDLPNGEQDTHQFGGVLPTPSAQELGFQNPASSAGFNASNARGDFEAKLAAMLQLAAQSQQQQQQQLPNLHSRDNFQDGGNYSRHNSHQDHRGSTNSATALNSGATVLLCSNLNEDDVTCDDLFTLFGVYGDVMRVKILFNKKDHALIQFADPSMASNALEHLNNMVLHGKAMRVAPSKHASITGNSKTTADDAEANLTKDYTNSPLHRYRKNRGRNPNIFKPIKSLHLANIPEDTSEEDIRKMFGEHGTVADFKFFHNDNRQAMLQMADVEQAILTLIRCHNQNHIKVSFAKKEMS